MPCAPDAPAWGEQYERHLAAVLDGIARWEDHPRAAEWDALTRQCVKQYREGHEKRRRRTTTRTSETREAVRLSGAEEGSAEHLDQLTLRGRAAYWRRVAKRTGSEHALATARALERHQRELARPRIKK